MAAPSKSPNVIAKYLPVYFTLLAIAALEFFLAYRHFSPGVLLAMFLALAVCGGTLAVRPGNFNAWNGGLRPNRESQERRENQEKNAR